MVQYHNVAELDGAQDALNKMRRAHERCAGCCLTADEVMSLSLTCIGSLWEQDDPRSASAPDEAKGNV